MKNVRYLASPTFLFLLVALLSRSAFALNSCSLAGGYGSCNNPLVAGIVTVTADAGYDVEIDGSYVSNTYYQWNTNGLAAGNHSLQECANQDQDQTTCDEEWVPNEVYVPDEVCSDNEVWVDDWECDAYDSDGNCTDYEDDGYYEDEPTCEDDGGYEDEGSYQQVCTDSTTTTYVCQSYVSVLVDNEGAFMSIINNYLLGK